MTQLFNSYGQKSRGNCEKVVYDLYNDSAMQYVRQERQPWNMNLLEKKSHGYPQSLK